MTAEARAQVAGMLWQRPLPASSDRSRRLTQDDVAHAAFAIAEAESLAATSTKRVAHRLAVPAPRLEQYLTSRGDLLDLMLEVALGEIEPIAVSADTDWKSQLRMLAAATYAHAELHPWLAELIGGRPPGGPAGLRFVERFLTAATGSGLTVPAAASAVNAILAFVGGSVKMRPQPQPEGLAQRNAEHLLSTVADGGYPKLAELFADPAGLSSDGSFADGVELLLDGIAAAAARADRRAAEPARL